MVALEMNFSAWVVTVPMPGNSCSAQQDSPQWTPQQPGELTEADHQHLEGQHRSVLGKDQENERKKSTSCHTEGQDPL